MFSLFVTNESGLIAQGQVKYGRGLGDMMDRFLVLRRNASDLAPGTTVILANAMGRTLRTFTTKALIQVVEKTIAPVLKLSEAMRQALDSDDSRLTGLAGKANTLKALEARGLVKIQNDGVARLTDLGRRYRRV